LPTLPSLGVMAFHNGSEDRIADLKRLNGELVMIPYIVGELPVVVRNLWKVVYTQIKLLPVPEILLFVASRAGYTLGFAMARSVLRWAVLVCHSYKVHVECLLIKEEFQTTLDTLKQAIASVILTARGMIHT